MKDGPEISRVAALTGDPARARILAALMDGRALTATELASAAGVTPKTANSHLTKLSERELLVRRIQGRHSYFALASKDAAPGLAALTGSVAETGQTRTRTGPRDETLRKARVCYNHLAGRLGVHLFDSLIGCGLLDVSDRHPRLTEAGTAFFHTFGIDVGALGAMCAPLCRECLDWSERRSHLAGSLGRACLSRMEALKWARRDPKSRAVMFSPSGLAAFGQMFPAA